MSTLLTTATDGQLYTGYDKLGDSVYCTPYFSGFQACIMPEIQGGFLAIKIVLQTPLERVSQSFKITNGIKFTWAPFSRFKLDVEIKNLVQTGNIYGFDGAFSICVNLPYFGWKCVSYSNHFYYRANLLHATQELSTADFNSQLILQLLLAEKNGACNC
jgi:hypothetical protein